MYVPNNKLIQVPDVHDAVGFVCIWIVELKNLCLY